MMRERMILAARSLISSLVNLFESNLPLVVAIWVTREASTLNMALESISNSKAPAALIISPEIAKQFNGL